MTMEEDVQRFLDEVCGFFGEETRGEYGMKQCHNCGDIAVEEYDKGQWICGHMRLGRALRMKTRKTNKL